MGSHTASAVQVENIWLWTWSGACFGYRRRDSLFTYDGREVGRFDGNEVYGSNVQYLGEVKDDRLITRAAHKMQKRATFEPTVRIEYAKKPDVKGRTLPAGFDDFPLPEKL
ncbi:MAG TPA: hypothetical protein VMZ52_21080 [Bryobacteraceae bacterium]|nr:hypothetical protein [Bryobacteraceae bacterium]